MGGEEVETRGLGDDEAKQDEQDGHAGKREKLPIDPACRLQPGRRGRRAGGCPAADRAPAVRVARIEAPAIELAVRAGVWPGPPTQHVRHQGLRTSLKTSSTGAFRAQTQAAAEARTKASSVKNSSANGSRLTSRLVIAPAAPLVVPARPAPTPKSPPNPLKSPKPPNPPNPANPPPAPALASA